MMIFGGVGAGGPHEGGDSGVDREPDGVRQWGQKGQMAGEGGECGEGGDGRGQKCKMAVAGSRWGWQGARV